jgi:hypothetical protein
MTDDRADDAITVPPERIGAGRRCAGPQQVPPTRRSPLLSPDRTTGVRTARFD